MESNCQFDSQLEKVKNRPDLLSYRGRVTYHWKALNKNYNFVLDHISIRGLLAKLWGFKIVGFLTGAISGTHSAIPWEKNHVDVSSVASHKVYYKGGRWWLPPSSDRGESSVSVLPVVRPLVLQLCTSHFVWVVCRPVWVSEACQLFLVPSQSSNMPLYPSKCYELRNVPRLLPLPMSLFGHTFESFKELGVRHGTW